MEGPGSVEELEVEGSSCLAVNFATGACLHSHGDVEGFGVSITGDDLNLIL